MTGSRYLWLTNPENLSEERAASFEELKNANLKTSRAWTIRELFRDFWNQAGPFTGHAFFKEWYAWASRCQLKPIIKGARCSSRQVRRGVSHLDQIVTWFDHRISNAAAEGFNSKIQALKSAARGFRNFENYRTRILFFCGRLQLHPETH